MKEWPDNNLTIFMKDFVYGYLGNRSSYLTSKVTVFQLISTVTLDKMVLPGEKPITTDFINI